MTTRDIQDQLKEMYGVEVSATLVREVTDAVISEELAVPTPISRLLPDLA